MKLHQEDWDMAKDFLAAKSFIVIYQGGRGTRVTTRDIPTYEAALVEKARIEAEHATYGRRACVYAITKGFYGVSVTDSVLYCVEELKRKV